MGNYMSSTKIPQLRVLVTDYCDSKCIYCRPSGEGNLNCHGLSMSYETAVQAAIAYRKIGGNEIKISGGDPAFWRYLSEYVAFLKKELKYERIELITRSVKIASRLDELNRSGLDVINFSLDTVDKDRYIYITKKSDFEQLVDIITLASHQMYCKINMVLLPDTSESEIANMIEFCNANDVDELKILDYIDDIQENATNINVSANQFDLIYKQLEKFTKNFSIAFQGKLGHPMRVYQISDSFKVTCKDARQGAWYCELCRKCSHYPCHDALMALRVTPSNSFQLCLLNNKMHLHFDSSNIEQQLENILKYYQNAFFKESHLHEIGYINSSQNRF